MLIFRRTNVLVQHLVSSLSLCDCSLQRLREVYRNLCSEQSPTECDDTRCCIKTICPPEDEHNSARNIQKNIINVLK